MKKEFLKDENGNIIGRKRIMASSLLILPIKN